MQIIFVTAWVVLFSESKIADRIFQTCRDILFLIRKCFLWFLSKRRCRDRQRLFVCLAIRYACPFLVLSRSNCFMQGRFVSLTKTILRPAVLSGLGGELPLGKVGAGALVAAVAAVCGLPRAALRRVAD